jgi:hypothetical protein
MNDEGAKLLLSNGNHVLVSVEDLARLSSGHWIQTTVHGKPLAYRRATAGPCVHEQHWPKRKHVVRLRPRLYLHREVLGLKRGDTARVSFRNGNSLDCRRSNLEIKTGGTVLEAKQVKGRKPYKVLVFIKGRPIHLGYWPTRTMANSVREIVAPLAHELRASEASHAQIKRQLQKAAGIR